jgi:hypothetical protein
VFGDFEDGLAAGWPGFEFAAPGPGDDAEGEFEAAGEDGCELCAGASEPRFNFGGPPSSWSSGAF